MSQRRPTREERKRRDPFELVTPLVAPDATASERPGESQPASIEAVERIERLTPSRMIPDRFQPRPILPLEIAQGYFAGDIDCYQAAAEWLQLVEGDKGIREQVDRLLAMGDSFSAHGQIKAITGSWLPRPDGQYIFQIETGERRFWAACLQYVRERRQVEPELRVEVVPHPTRERQVIENRHAEEPTPVGQAREVAALILAEVGVEPSAEIADPYEYFRQALAIPRMPRGLWDKMVPLMQVSRPRMEQLLAILNLPTPLLEKANRSRLSYRVLSAVLAESPDKWEALVDAAIAADLRGEDIAEVAAGTSLPLSAEASPPPVSRRLQPADAAFRGIRGFSRALARVSTRGRARVMDDLADEIFVRGDAEPMLTLLEELAKLLRMRVKRKG